MVASLCNNLLGHIHAVFWFRAMPSWDLASSVALFASKGAQRLQRFHVMNDVQSSPSEPGFAVYFH